MNLATRFINLISKGLNRVPSSNGNTWIGPVDGSFSVQAMGERPDPPAALLKSSAVFSCVTGIASDIAKLRIKLCRDKDGIWTEITNSPYISVLEEPNHYQNRMQFLEQWALSKLLTGNAYILLGRDDRGVVRKMYPLNPFKTWPLVSDSGDVFYQLRRDPLSGNVEDQDIIPASEIIHDRMNCMWHPLVGISPLYACAASGSLGNKIQASAMKFFQNRALPGGLISVTGVKSQEEFDRVKKEFQQRFSGDNIGNLAIFSSEMKFTPMQMTAEASQLAEQLKLSVEDVARAFHYPQFKLGGHLPTTTVNVEATIMMYYTDCLQQYIEAIEICLDEGLGLSDGLHTELDLDGLMRMDTASMYEANNKAVSGGWMKPNEARYMANLPPVEGGDTPYLQQQNFSLAALNKRDQMDNPFEMQRRNPAPTDTDGKNYHDNRSRIGGYQPVGNVQPPPASALPSTGSSVTDEKSAVSNSLSAPVMEVETRKEWEAMFCA